ncbi:Protein cbp3, mitochondrial [Xylographa pallens]|nr:Protein cbp3, mitochondrial [Xylographa pallens]
MRQQLSRNLHRRAQYTFLRPFSQSPQIFAVTQAAENLPVAKKVRHISPKGPANPSASTTQGLRPQTAQQSPTRKLAQEFRKRAPETTETYVAYGVSEALVKECARQADYSIPQAKEKGVEIPKAQDGEDLGVGTGWWYEEMGLTPTFNTWAQITFLHMYLLTVRIRCFPAAHAPTWNQHMINHFSYLAEERMVTVHNIQARMVRNKYLKDLFVQWRGLTAGYDEGLVKGDAVLAAAVWRNVCKADENVDLQKLGMVVAYMRSVLSALDTMDDSAVATGDVVFGSPSNEAALVKQRSKMMDMEFTSENQAPVVL